MIFYVHPWPEVRDNFPLLTGSQEVSPESLMALIEQGYDIQVTHHEGVVSDAPTEITLQCSPGGRGFRQR